MKPVLNCQACGVCCIAEHDTDFHAELNEREEAAGPFSPEGCYAGQVVDLREHGNEGAGVQTKWRKISSGPLRGLEICGCYFLQGTPLVQVQCRCYADRPQVCREFKPGSKVCRDAVAWLQRQAEE
jgi:Fe-S-cluster containining protein